MALSGQRVVVIGGSSGMGLATARAAARAGAEVTIASSDEGRVAAALAELPDACEGAVVDTRDEEAVAALFARVGELDHVVFTAGDAVRPQPLADLSLEAARQLLEVRFWGTVATVKYAAPRIRPGGSIALTSGTVSVRPVAGAALASGAASATEGLARGLAVELAPIRVNAVRPGAIRTPLWDPVPEPQRAALFSALADQTLTRSIGEAEQIAAAHLYLMENAFVTGTVLTVDGGALLAGSR
ncbi:putative short chain dehydrogenase [Actinacidiphila reveromycinica]|uniref:Putative short chain dehydrogenase n=1 Tax=Actinacidiphila reveromycinica TaxID=659352 RepID=A0A7U3UVN5_9ACTN|nr:SDR family oxidoreductase [Streptomyces sp. SN-593]BBA99697.1 putative short chain dehydrogenase [Streptomyces sp. SN-593]